jgi:hypothetical protein
MLSKIDIIQTFTTIQNRMLVTTQVFLRLISKH